LVQIKLSNPINYFSSSLLLRQSSLERLSIASF
jgi:hypothetical protein